MGTTAPSLETALNLPLGSFTKHLQQRDAEEQAECPLDAASCSAAAWWDSGWMRAHKLHIGPDRTITHEQFIKIVRREHRANVRYMREPNTDSQTNK
jgi:hypothetical protein